MEYAIAAFLIFFLLIGSGLLLLFYREALGARLKSILAASGNHNEPVQSKVSEMKESFGSFASSLQKIVPKTEAEASVVRKRLVMAGYRREGALNAFYFFKGMLPVVLCVLLVVTGWYSWNPFILFLMAGAAGYLAPDYWLGHRIKERSAEIRSGLPDVLDLLVVCLEAGLSLDQAVLRANEELAISHPVMADELGLVMLEVRAGKRRVDAWKSLAERTDVEPVRLLVSILVQADQFGTGISKTLRVHSDTMRTRRRQQIEELAAKTTVKLIFPLAFFIFPSIFIVTLGPAYIQLSTLFK